VLLTVKQFENWSIFDEVINRTNSVPFFGHPVELFSCRFVQALSINEIDGMTFYGTTHPP